MASWLEKRECKNRSMAQRLALMTELRKLHSDDPSKFAEFIKRNWRGLTPKKDMLSALCKKKKQK